MRRAYTFLPSGPPKATNQPEFDFQADKSMFIGLPISRDVDPSRNESLFRSFGYPCWIESNNHSKWKMIQYRTDKHGPNIVIISINLLDSLIERILFVFTRYRYKDRENVYKRRQKRSVIDIEIVQEREKHFQYEKPSGMKMSWGIKSDPLLALPYAYPVSQKDRENIPHVENISISRCVNQRRSGFLFLLLALVRHLILRC